jgi:Putative transposase/Transposase zinc-binding domain
MPELAEVFRRYGGAYLARFGGDLLPSHRRAIEDILHCRTEVLGGHLLQCDHCGQEHYVYHSCRNRSCPKCHRTDTEAWLEERRQELLPVPYFHVVFTAPHELGEIIRRHQQDLYDILLRAAAQSLMKLAMDPHYVGGLIGVLCVLHTWTRTLAYHPHVHCLVPAGAVSPDRSQWQPARTSYLVPVHALSKLFRGLFRALVRQQRPDLSIPESVWAKGWVVYCKPAIQGPEKVLNYLGRYVHRIALTNSRILSIEDGQICFRYRDSQAQRWQTMTLPADEFIRRFLQHVLPQGFHKVRYYGLWSPVHRPLLHQLQLCLAGHEPSAPRESPDRERQPPTCEYSPLQAGQLCPHCGQGLLVVIRLLPRHQRGPP